MESETWLDRAEEALESVCRRAASPDALLRDAFHQLSRSIPNRGGLLYHYPGSQPGFTPLEGSLASAFDDVDPALLRPENDPSHRPARVLAARPRVVPATDRLSREEFQRSPAYREVYAPHGVDHIVCAWLDGRRPGEAGMLGMMLSRDDGLGAFEDEHLTLLRNVLPVLVLAARDSPGLGALAVPRVVLDHQGATLDISPTAHRILAEMAIGADELVARLFGEIRRWLELRVRRGATGFLSATRLFHVVERRGRTLYVRTTERGGVLELCLLQSAPSLDRLREVRGLTPAEIAVLQALAFGMSNADAAAFLCVNVDTVKTHVRRLLQKLELRSRLQAGLMMQRVLWDAPR